MTQSTIDTPPSDPLGPLVASWSETESSRAEQIGQLLEPIEQTLQQLSDWADLLDSERQAAEEEREAAAKREAALEERQRLLQRDLKLARNRVTELEATLQSRTEELLRTQASNNALAAELQAIESDDAIDYEIEEDMLAEVESLADETGEEFAEGAESTLCENDVEASESDEHESDNSNGVAERFARVRRTG